ncbi:MAG: hypothetical protein AAGG02_09970 [Cyanobacteria bacterium P01_H01_bin.15]
MSASFKEIVAFIPDDGSVQVFSRRNFSTGQSVTNPVPELIISGNTGPADTYVDSSGIGVRLGGDNRTVSGSEVLLFSFDGANSNRDIPEFLGAEGVNLRLRGNAGTRVTMTGRLDDAIVFSENLVFDSSTLNTGDKLGLNIYLFELGSAEALPLFDEVTLGVSNEISGSLPTGFSLISANFALMS